MRFICQLICLMLLLWPGQSAAKPWRLSSDNFVLQGDISETQGQKLLTDLELYRESLFHFMGAEPMAEPISVQIYAAKNDKDIGQISGARGFGGLYTRTHHGPSLLINRKIGFGRNGQARHIALHEYSHHFVNEHSALAYPRWYNEGIADYLATFTYKDGVFHIGKPYEAAIAALGKGAWLPIETLLESVNDYPFKGQESALQQSVIAQKYYAQTWLMVHYLQSHKDYRARLEGYLLRLNGGQDSLGVFEAAFKISPEDFQAKLRAYHDKGDYKSRIFSRPPLPLPEIASAKLSRAELALAKLSARRDFSWGGPRAAKTIEAIKAYEKKYKPSPASLRLKADLAEVNPDEPEVFEQALSDIENALAQEPENLAAKLIAARLIVQGKAKALDVPPEQQDLARQYISEVLEAHPNHKYGRVLQRAISAQAP